jgi:hypothetical protein
MLLHAHVLRVRAPVVLAPPRAALVHPIRVQAGHRQVGVLPRAALGAGSARELEWLEEALPQLAVSGRAVHEQGRVLANVPVDPHSLAAVVAERVMQVVDHTVDVREEPSVPGRYDERVGIGCRRVPAHAASLVDALHEFA